MAVRRMSRKESLNVCSIEPSDASRTFLSSHTAMDGVLRSEWRYSVKRDNALSFKASSFNASNFKGVKLLEVA
jgi:hypothetical protein